MGIPENQLMEEENIREKMKDLMDARRETELREVRVGYPLLRFFEFSHLPPHLQEISQPIAELAKAMAASLPECAETAAGLRKLLEAAL